MRPLPTTVSDVGTHSAQALLGVLALAWVAAAALIDPLVLPRSERWLAIDLRALGGAALLGTLAALRHRRCTPTCAVVTLGGAGAILCAIAGLLAGRGAATASVLGLGAPYDLTPALLVIATATMLAPPARTLAPMTALWAASYVAALAPSGLLTGTSVVAAAVAHGAVLGLGVAASHRGWRLRHELFASRRLGDYRLMSPLGGGMSEVWLAWDEVHRREVALKLLRVPGATAATRARFAREVELVRALRSPYITRVYDFGVTDDGFAYIAFEYLRGMDLEALVAAFGPLEPARAVQLFIGACKGLGVAHRVGVLHRDVKPANLHCCDRKGEEDQVHLLDFGVARAIDTAGVTLDGTVVGTPAYMSPEAFDGSPPTPAGDVYALGAALYFAVTGVPPFDGDSAADLGHAHQRAPVVPPSLRAQLDLPRALEKVMLRCLAKAPADRYPDATALGEALEACARLLPPWKREDAARWWHRARAGRVATPALTQARTTEVELIATPRAR